MVGVSAASRTRRRRWRRSTAAKPSRATRPSRRGRRESRGGARPRRRKSRRAPSGRASRRRRGGAPRAAAREEASATRRRPARRAREGAEWLPREKRVRVPEEEVPRGMGASATSRRVGAKSSGTRGGQTCATVESAGGQAQSVAARKAEHAGHDGDEGASRKGANAAAEGRSRRRRGRPCTPPRRWSRRSSSGRARRAGARRPPRALEAARVAVAEKEREKESEPVAAAQRDVLVGEEVAERESARRGRGKGARLAKTHTTASAMQTCTACITRGSCVVFSRTQRSRYQSGGCPS